MSDLLVTELRDDKMQKKSLLITDSDLDGVSCALVGKMFFRYPYNTEGLDIMFRTVYNYKDTIREIIKNGAVETYETIYVTDLSIDEEIHQYILDHSNPIRFRFNDHHQQSLAFNRPYNKKVIYHDPCFLGKQNKIFEEPRRILQAVESVELLEFSASRENSLCCEGGGGRMFYEAENTYQRNSERRTKEALAKGADILATSCPFCLMTLEDSAAETGLPVKDLSEIIIEAL